MGRTVGVAGAWCLALLCAAPLCAQGSVTALEKAFASPPANARVMMRWWWFGPAVTQPELLRELTEMKSADIGGFEIQPVYPLALDDPPTGFRNLPYLSHAFLDDVRYVNNEAQTLGLRASLTLASGWPYGGPHTPVTEAAGAIRLIPMQVAAGQGSVPVPHISNGEALVGVFLAPGDWTSKTRAQAPPHMLGLPAPGDTRLTLPTAAGGDARTVLWFVSTRTGQQVKRAAVGAEGFVLDHFSRQAVQDHLKNVANPLMTAFGAHPPYSVFSDSLEVFGSDWTPEILQQFQQRRGYSLLPYLPDLFTAHPDQQALEVRHDWGATLTELTNENYLQQIDTWAHAHHTRFRSQTYGEPAVSLSSNALVDLPEGEGPQWQQFSYTRWATSAAHLYGRPIVSSETWTWLHSPAFRATPLDMKAEADRFFLQGINQLMGHGWPYSPPSAGEPGWRFYAAGALNAHNPWWVVMPDVMRYMQRISWMLRQGMPANQVAVYLPEDDAYAGFTPGHVSLTQLMPHWITPALTEAIEEGGYNFDYIDSAAIAARGIHYPVLLLPNVDRISPATLKRVEQYCEQGGKVIALGRLPGDAPGLLHNAEQSAQVRGMVHQLFPGKNDKYATVLVANTADLLPALHSMVAPDMQLSSISPAVGFIRRKLKDADVYFVANTGNMPVHTMMRLQSKYHAGTWLDADTGSADVLPSTQQIVLDLAPYQSRLLLLHADAPNVRDSQSGSHSSDTSVVADVSTGWEVNFAGRTLPVSMPQLSSWTDNPATLYYSGVATYRHTVSVPNGSFAKSRRLLLSFGAGKSLAEPAAMAKHPGMQAWYAPPVRDAAVVYINGRLAGALWHPPYLLDVTSLLKPGKNMLEVRVANTAINAMAGKALPDYRLLWARYGKRFAPQDTENLKPLPSGLLGAVQLLSRSTP